LEVIRQLKAEDFEQNIALSEYAFQYELSEQEKQIRKEQFRPEEVWGVFAGDRLAAKLAVYPLAIWIQGKRFAMGGIGGVATWPEYRRNGYVGRLMRKSLEAMREAGMTVSLLAPFSYSFYRKYGWETFMERKKYEVETAKLTSFPPYEGRIERIVPEQAISLLSMLYETYAAKYNGMLSRSEDWWKRAVLKNKSETCAVYYNQAGNPSGYLIYQVKNRHFQVKELIWLDEEALLALWKFIGNHDSMAEKATLWAPADDMLPFLLNEPRIRQELVPHFMARIVDVRAFLEQYPFAPLGKEWRFVLRVEDGSAPWNNGMFSVAVDGEGKAAVEVWADGQEHDPDASCDIQTLSALLVASRPAEWLRRAGKLKCDLSFAAALAQYAPSRHCFLLDGF
jgi:predicted acetyltransferase